MTERTRTATIPADLDHVVLAGPDLAEAIDAVERLTGVRAAPGGKHPTGTANALIAFTIDGARVPLYLEVIGPDPEGERDATEIETFSIRERTAPAVATFAIHPADIEVTAQAATDAGVDLGAIQPLSRRTPSGELLEWRLTRGERRDEDPAIPFLIDWGTTAQPGLGDIPTLELLAVLVEHPDAATLTQTYAVLGIDTEIVQADAFALVLTVQGPDGAAVELR